VAVWHTAKRLKVFWFFFSKKNTLPSPSLLDFTKVIIRVGLTSFGGGLSGWFLREFVTSRRWLTEEEFLSGLSLAQVFPGVNVVNLSIWIGYRLHGGRGALAGALSIVVPPMLVVIAFAVVFRSLAGYAVAHTILDGVAAAAIGLSLSMGLRAAQRSARNLGAVLVLAASFVAIGVLHWPLFLVVAGLAPVSIAHAAWRLRHAR